jgi:histidine decarboxylase
MAADTTPPVARTGIDPATQAELDQLHAALVAARARNIGFPAAADIDAQTLAPFLDFMLNNLGDPNVDGTYPHHAKTQEREAVQTVADLLRAPADDRWGYVASGASEGTEHALWLARHRFPGGVVYRSQAAHHCVPAAIDRLAMTAVVIRATEHGEIDYQDLAGQVDQRRDRPVIVVANIGTAMSEAVDDVRRINQVLDERTAIHRWVHADAALSGIPLALLDPAARPGFDFADGATSMVVSGHKLGTPMPCAMLVVRNSHRPYGGRPATYTGSPDNTLANSRSGLAALAFWLILRRYGVPGLRARADQAREVAAYAHGRLVEIGWPARRHPYAFTVVLATPPDPVLQKWPLPSDNGHSHIVCMPGVSREQVDDFVTDLQSATTPAVSNAASDGHRRRGLLPRSQPAPDTATVA